MASALAGCGALRCAPSPAARSQRCARSAPRRATRCSAERAPAAAEAAQATPLARRKALLSAAAGAALCALPAAPLPAAAADSDGLPEVTQKVYLDVTGAAPALCASGAPRMRRSS
jgi:hypothetical protein